jgi:hypothetical protein
MPLPPVFLTFFRRCPLRREIAAILLMKAAIIVLAVFFLFGPRHRLHVTTQIMQTQLLDTSAPAGGPEHMRTGR